MSLVFATATRICSCVFLITTLIFLQDEKSQTDCGFACKLSADNPDHNVVILAFRLPRGTTYLVTFPLNANKPQPSHSRLVSIMIDYCGLRTSYLILQHLFLMPQRFELAALVSIAHYSIRLTTHKLQPHA